MVTRSTSSSTVSPPIGDAELEALQDLLEADRPADVGAERETDGAFDVGQCESFLSFRGGEAARRPILPPAFPGSTPGGIS